MLPTLKINVERWKWNEELRLWVSTEGRLRDESKDLIELMVNENGYLVFFNETRQVFTNVHRVVLETWRPRVDMRELTVEHKDQNKRNPALRNLMWLIPEENLRRAQYHDLGQSKKSKGAKNANKKICANGVVMTVEEAVTFIYNLPEHTKMSKAEVRAKVNKVLCSSKQKKEAFGVTFTEVEK